LAKVYKNSVLINIIVNVGIDLTNAVSVTLNIKKPSGATMARTPTIDADRTKGLVYYLTQASDLNEAGIYYVQPVIEMNIGQGTNAVWYGETDTFEVYEAYA
jgi:hypothetical protein